MCKSQFSFLCVVTIKLVSFQSSVKSFWFLVWKWSFFPLPYFICRLINRIVRHGSLCLHLNHTSQCCLIGATGAYRETLFVREDRTMGFFLVFLIISCNR